MRAMDRTVLKMTVLAGIALAASVGLRAQSSAPASGTAPSTTSTSTKPAAQAPASTTASSGAAQTTSTANPTASQPAPGTMPVGGDAPAPAKQPDSGTASTTTASDTQLAPCETGKNADKKEKKKDKDSKDTADNPEPGTTAVGGDCAGPVAVDVDKIVDPGSQMIPIKPGSIEDVNAVGNREIGKRGLGNWYSTDGEIKMGKQFADEIEKSTKFITDPVVDEYVNRIGQNIVKNSDCKVPFTIKVIDSDEINAMALPGGFFYVNSGLILAADEEAELAGVMAHETAHVCAHHAAREMTRLNYAEIGMVPLEIMLPYDLAGYGIYEAAQLAIPITFLQFSRDFEAQADYLGVQYMYRSGYDPQAFITFFEKVQALEKRKPGLVAKAFSDHPQTPDRIL
ncbi:MAG: M48 family metalloprotease, partial [Candidatus Sulfotelmatobacter sp.]